MLRHTILQYNGALPALFHHRPSLSRSVNSGLLLFQLRKEGSKHFDTTCGVEVRFEVWHHSTTRQTVMSWFGTPYLCGLHMVVLEHNLGEAPQSIL